MLRRLLWKNCLGAGKLDCFIEKFLAFCRGGLRAVKEIVPDIPTFRFATKRKSAKRQPYRLTVEQFEDIIAPATYTWDGGGSDSNWSTAANWTSDTVPTSSDTANIDNSADTVVLDSNVTVANLTMSAGTLESSTTLG